MKTGDNAARSGSSHRTAILKDIPPAGQLAAGCSCLGALTLLAFQFQINLTTIAFADLLLVFTVALFWGFWQASVISVLAFASLDYFFTRPVFHFTISDPQDWVSLAAFEFSALFVSRLSTREMQSAHQAALHRRGMEQLYELSRNTMLLDLRQPPGPQLAVLLQRIFRLEAVALFDATCQSQGTSGTWADDQASVARTCYQTGSPLDDPATRTAVRILRGGKGTVGVIALRGELDSLVIDALASLAALAFDRFESFEKEESAENARKAEQLRGAVMDALAHDFKTPLSTVHTAASALLEFGNLRENQSELVTVIDQETARMIDLCTRLLLTARLHTGNPPSAPDELNVADFLNQLVSAGTDCDSAREIAITLEDPELTVRADRSLLAMILSQYLDNARKYSTPGTPIEIAARKSYDEALFSVHNFGPIIPLEDRDRIFDRFYRSPAHVDSVPGTGIGLSVVKKAANAHKGHVWVVSDKQQGTTFFLSIPIVGGEAQ